MRTSRKTAALAAAVALLLGACRMPPENAPDPGVSQAVEYLIERDNARDLEGVLAGYTDDVVWLPPTGEVIEGKAALRARYEELFSKYDVAMSVEVVEAQVAGSGGFARGYVHGTLTPRAGGAPVIVEDKFLAFTRYDGDAWRVTRLTWSPNEERGGP